MTDEEFLSAFEACTLTDFHHRDHIKLAYLHLLRHPPEEAAAKVGAGLRKFAAFHGAPTDKLDVGYHETMTQAWVRLVHATLCEYGPAESADAFFEKQPQLAQKDSLRFFYTRDRLYSWQAKKEFIEPDLAPLPQSRKSAKFFQSSGIGSQAKVANKQTAPDT